MAGDMPVIDAFEDTMSVNDASMWGNWLDLDLHVEGDYGWGMVSGDVDLWDYVDTSTGDPTIQYGDPIVLDDDDLWDWVGCAGPESGYADFDEAPNVVRITFEDPKTLGLVPEDAEIGPSWVGAVVDAGFGTGDAVRAVTLVNLQ
ncbi:MAG: hypothetical protein ACJAZO_001900 [Myxococcota bacterium]|jgi:hypothetical protein